MSLLRRDNLRTQIERSEWNSQLLYITRSRYGKDWHSSHHSHPFAEIFYVIDGRGQFLVEGQHYEVKKDTLIFVNPHVAHTETSLRDFPLEYYVVGINHISLMSEDKNTPTHYLLHNFSAHMLYAPSFFDYLFQEILNPTASSATICQNILEIIILEMQKARALTIVNIAETKQVREAAMARRFIEQNYSEEITLDTLAELTQTSKFHLARLFKDHFGLTPIRYLTQRRIEMAKSLLLTTDLSIRQIAESVGFASSSYFTQTFHKETGQTPKDFREN